MRSKELDAAISVFRRVLASSEAGQVHRQALELALRELVVLKRGGKMDPRRVGLAVETVSKILADEFLRKRK
jgi:hypothetical protein